MKNAAAIDFKTGDVLDGYLPQKELALVREWLRSNANELQEIWQTQEFRKLSPLKQGDTSMIHRIKNIAPASGFILRVQFYEGIVKTYDMSPLFDQMPIFRQLKTNLDLFNAVSVDTGGYGIVWNDELDLSCDELWENGTAVETPFDGLLSFRDATELWGLNESTLRKAISYGKFIDGIDVCKFGKQWVVTIDAMEREYGRYPKEKNGNKS
jgi:hypothetical protein